MLIAADRRPEAIRLLEAMPAAGVRRAEISVMLAQAYLDQQRYDDCVKLLAATPYFVNWEGQGITWDLFNRRTSSAAASVSSAATRKARWPTSRRP